MNANPNSTPVCKLMDYGKFSYDMQKKEREQKKRQAQSMGKLKEMKFRIGIGKGDYETKKGHIERFLNASDKVKITVMLRGRELSHAELGVELLLNLAEDLQADMVGKTVNVLQAPKIEGKNITMVVVAAPSK